MFLHGGVAPHSLPRCLESLQWDDGPNVLGRGGRVYLDGDVGDAGCQYGVHVQWPSGRFYPCALSWTFFNVESQSKLAFFLLTVNCRAFCRSSESLSEPVLYSDVPRSLNAGAPLTKVPKGSWS